MHDNPKTQSTLGTRHRTMTNNTIKTQSTLGTRHRTMTNNTIKTQSTLGTRHRTMTNNTIKTTQKTKKMSDIDPTKNDADILKQIF